MSRLLTLAVLIVFAWSPLANGASAREASGGADARLQSLVQQLTMERASLQAEKGRLAEENESLETMVKKLEGELADERNARKQADGELGAEKARSGAYEQQNEQLRDRLQELADRYRELAEVLAKIESQRDDLVALAQDYDARVVVCERNNEDLYTIVNELIAAYQDKGVFRTLMEKEPFTQLKRVQVENMMDEYRYLAEDMRLKFDLDDDVSEARGTASETGSNNSE